MSAEFEQLSPEQHVIQAIAIGREIAAILKSKQFGQEMAALEQAENGLAQAQQHLPGIIKRIDETAGLPGANPEKAKKVEELKIDRLELEVVSNQQKITLPLAELFEQMRGHVEAAFIAAQLDVKSPSSQAYISELCQIDLVAGEMALGQLHPAAFRQFNLDAFKEAMGGVVNILDETLGEGAVYTAAVYGALNVEIEHWTKAVLNFGAVRDNVNGIIEATQALQEPGKLDQQGLQERVGALREALPGTVQNAFQGIGYPPNEAAAVADDWARMAEHNPEAVKDLANHMAQCYGMPKKLRGDVRIKNPLAKRDEIKVDRAVERLGVGDPDEEREVRNALKRAQDAAINPDKLAAVRERLSNLTQVVAAR